MWTLWLITFAAGQGAATPAVTPMATYQSQAECVQAIDSIFALINKQFPKGNVGPGLPICVAGNLVKK